MSITSESWKVGFNGAATSSLQKGLGAHDHLGLLFAASMGPQLHRCGKGHSQRDRPPVPWASMGPQLHRCGKPPRRRHPHTGRRASMGPQLHRCGKRRSSFSVRPALPLQWGRNFIVAESLIRQRSPSTLGRFNGAATSSLRKVVTHAVILHE